MILRVYRVEPEYKNKQVAELNIYKNEKGQIEVEVRSQNPAIRNHLADVVSVPYYMVSPFSVVGGVNSLSSLFVEPGTRLFLIYLRDRLGWYGYIVDLPSDVSLKSLIDEFNAEVVWKSVAGDISQYMRPAADGMGVILTRVPSGYMAVSRDGRVVGPGKFLNARIGTPDANWSLVPLATQTGKKTPASEVLSKEKVEEIQNKKKLQKLLANQIKLGIHAARKNPEAAKKLFEAVLALDKLSGGKLTEKRVLTKDELQEIKDVAEENYEEEGFVRESIPLEKVAEELKLNIEEIKKNVGDYVKAMKKFFINIRDLMPDSSIGEDEIDDTYSRVANKYSLEGKVAVKFTDKGILFGRNAGVASVLSFGTSRVHLFDASGVMKRIEKMSDKELKSFLREVATGKKKVRRSEALYALGELLARKNNSNSFVLKSDKYKKLVESILQNTEDDKLKKEDARNVHIAVSTRVFSKPFEGYIPVKEEIDYLSEIEKIPANPKGKDEYKAVRTEIETKYFNENGRLKKDAPKKELSEIVKEYAKAYGLKIRPLRWNPAISLAPEERGGPYQSAVVSMALHPKAYRITGGNPDGEGFLYLMQQGTGKTISVLATISGTKSLYYDKLWKAENKKTNTEMEKLSVVFAPNPSTWVDEIIKTKVADKDEILMVAGLSKEQRLELYRNILKQIESGDLKYKYIVFNTGKLRKDRVSDVLLEDTEDEDMLSEVVGLDAMDIEFLKLLTSGIKDEDGDVITEDSMIGSLVIDEAGLFANPNSNRSKIIMALRDAVAARGGLIFAAEGVLIKNSVSDYMRLLSLVDGYVRRNEKELVASITKPLKYNKRIPPIGKDASIEEFHKFAKTMHSLSLNMKILRNKDIIGVDNRIRNYGELNFDDIPPEVKEFFTEHYRKHEKHTFVQNAIAYTAMRYLNEITRNQPDQVRKEARNALMAYLMGSFSQAVFASLGTISPRTIFEYNLPISREVMRRINQKYGEDVANRVYAKIQEYLYETTYQASSVSGPTSLALAAIEKAKDAISELNPNLPRSILDRMFTTLPKPKADMPPHEKMKKWNTILDEDTREKIEEAVKDIERSVASFYVAKLEDALNNGKDDKIIFTSMSKELVNNVSEMLKQKYGDKYDVFVITGDTPEEERREIQEKHKNSDKRVVTFVTTAGGRGLNLPAKKVIRTPFWSMATAEQAESRAQRNPRDEIKIDVVVPEGYGIFMNRIEQAKGLMASELEKIVSSTDLSESSINEVYENLMTNPKFTGYFFKNMEKHLEEIGMSIGMPIRIPKE